MNYEQARAALVTMINAELPQGVHVAWDNTGDIDVRLVSPLAIKVEVLWDDAGQIAMGAEPPYRVTGSVFVHLIAVEGNGTLQLCQLMDRLTDSLKFRASDSLRTTLPRPGPRPTKNGLCTQELHVPFYFDSIT